MNKSKVEEITWLDPEEYAYRRGRFARKGRAILRENPHNPIDLPYGKVVSVQASIPDTFFSIPARIEFRGKRVAGFLMMDDESRDWTFTPEAE